MPSGASFTAVAYFSELHTDIIKYNHDVFFRIELIEVTYCDYALAREIHVGHRLEEQDLLSIEISLRDESFEFRVFEFTTFPSFCEIIQE